MTSTDSNLDIEVRKIPASSYEVSIDNDRQAILTIVEAMATIHGCSSTDLNPLYDTVDPTLLERVGDRPNHQEFRFISNGLEVTVSGDGTVRFEHVR